jgi:uncharacterized membrane protein
MIRRLVQSLLVAIAFIASAVAWPRIPERVPVHWTLAGEVDRYGTRLEAALIMPVAMLLLWALMRFLPRIDPRRASYARMAGTYELVISLLLATFLAIHATVLGVALGYAVPMGTVVPLIIGLLLIVLGNVLPRARPNWWFGVRTPWTLSSDRVWARTHRLAGHAMFFAGLAFVAMAFVDAPWASTVLVVAIVGSLLAPVVYSYVAWRQERPG